MDAGWEFSIHLKSFWVHARVVKMKWKLQLRKSDQRQ